MAIKTPIILNGNFHSPIGAGDTLDPQYVKIVSADAGNDITAGSDGGAFLDTANFLTSVSVGAGLQGNGTSGSPVAANLDTLPDASGALAGGTKVVISGGDGQLATSAQLAALIASDVSSSMAKGDLIAGTNVSFSGTATSRLIGAGNLTIDVSGAAPTGAAGGDLNGSFPNPTVDGIQGTPVSSTAPTSGQALVFNGTSYVPVTVIPFAPQTTPLPTSANNSSIPTQYFGQNNNYYLGTPVAWARFAYAGSSTGFGAYPIYEIA